MREPRTISFDDGFFECWRGRTLLVGVVMRKSVLEGVCSRPVRVDGADVTPAIISMVKGSKHRQCLQCVFLAGVTFAGACVADVERIRDETGLPVVVVSR
ncbi:MAG: DUF99 family protein, partial [Candidatus Diapherotrites archaeon]|nr:DUF99 family protein [Candidatus Diapherotrites archaeon]